MALKEDGIVGEEESIIDSPPQNLSSRRRTISNLFGSIVISASTFIAAVSLYQIGRERGYAEGHLAHQKDEIKRIEGRLSDILKEGKINPPSVMPIPSEQIEPNKHTLDENELRILSKVEQLPETLIRLIDQRHAEHGMFSSAISNVLSKALIDSGMPVSLALDLAAFASIADANVDNNQAWDAIIKFLKKNYKQQLDLDKIPTSDGKRL